MRGGEDFDQVDAGVPGQGGGGVVHQRRPPGGERVHLDGALGVGDAVLVGEHAVHVVGRQREVGRTALVDPPTQPRPDGRGERPPGSSGDPGATGEVGQGVQQQHLLLVGELVEVVDPQPAACGDAVREDDPRRADHAVPWLRGLQCRGLAVAGRGDEQSHLGGVRHDK